MITRESLKFYIVHATYVHSHNNPSWLVLAQIHIFFRSSFNFGHMKLIHAVRNFRSWGVMTKVRYFFNFKLIIWGLYRGWTWSGDLPKTLIYLNFDPMGFSRARKFKKKHKKITWTKIPDGLNSFGHT